MQRPLCYSFLTSCVSPTSWALRQLIYEILRSVIKVLSSSSGLEGRRQVKLCLSFLPPFSYIFYKICPEKKKKMTTLAPFSKTGGHFLHYSIVLVLSSLLILFEKYGLLRLVCCSVGTEATTSNCFWWFACAQWSSMCSKTQAFFPYYFLLLPNCFCSSHHFSPPPPKKELWKNMQIIYQMIFC